MVTTESTIRHYEPEDYPMLKSWWEGHGADPMHHTMIPPSSCVVLLDGQPAAFGAVFLCNSNHVGFFHGMVTRPGLTVKEAKTSLQHLQHGLDIIMRTSGHTLLLGTVRPGAMVRGAMMMGFTPDGDPVQQVSRIVKPQPTYDHGT